jgi:hypothetical protein
LNLLEENLGVTFQDLAIGNDFLNRIPITQEIIAKNDKWNYIKLKSFCTETFNKMKRKLTEKEENLCLQQKVNI